MKCDVAGNVLKDCDQFRRSEKRNLTSKTHFLKTTMRKTRPIKWRTFSFFCSPNPACHSGGLNIEYGERFYKDRFKSHK